MAKENLLIVIATDNVDSILKFPLLYGGVSIPREYWKRVHIMFWGASIVCANEYEATDSLESIGIVCNHTGELLTTALKNDDVWAMITL
jgi:hypothetical protein